MYLNNSKASQDPFIPVKNVKDNVGIFKDTPKTLTILQTSNKSV